MPIPRSLLAHMRRWERSGARYVVEVDGQSVGSVKTAFKRALAEAGIDHCTRHDLRHTAVTWAMQNGADKWAAAGFFGLTLDMLERVYGHHHPEHMRSAVEAMEASPIEFLPHGAETSKVKRPERKQNAVTTVIRERTNGLVWSSGGGGPRFKSAHSDHFPRRQMVTEHGSLCPIRVDRLQTPNLARYIGDSGARVLSSPTCAGRWDSPSVSSSSRVASASGQHLASRTR